MHDDESRICSEGGDVYTMTGLTGSGPNLYRAIGSSPFRFIRGRRGARACRSAWGQVDGRSHAVGTQQVKGKNHIVHRHDIVQRTTLSKVFSVYSTTSHNEHHRNNQLEHVTRRHPPRQANCQRLEQEGKALFRADHSSGA